MTDMMSSQGWPLMAECHAARHQAKSTGFESYSALTVASERPRSPHYPWLMEVGSDRDCPQSTTQLDDSFISSKPVSAMRSAVRESDHISGD